MEHPRFSQFEACPSVQPCTKVMPSYENIKKWIKTQEGVVKAGKSQENTRTDNKKLKEEGMRTRIGAEAYIRGMRRYLSTGDWTNLYYGEYEEKPMKWKTIAPAYK